jgi:DNA-binding MarR family transcriptional regulator
MVDLTDEQRLRTAIEVFYFAYREFTAGADRVLAQRGLGRVHHRILYFVARNPDVSVKRLLEILAISKQALHVPLRQLLGMELVKASADPADARVRRLRLTAEGARLEARLSAAQMRQLASAFEVAGRGADEGWFSVMRAFAAPAGGARPGDGPSG